MTGVLLVTGCGGDGGGKESQQEGKSEASRQSPAKAVQATSKRTAEAKTAKIDLTVTASGSESKTVRGDGVMNLRDGTSQLDMGIGGEHLQQRVVGSTLYQELPEKAAAQLPDGKTWSKIDLKKLQASTGGEQTGVQNPADSLAYSKSLSEKDVKKLGTEKVNGTKTTHYRVQLDLSKLAKGDAAQEKKLRQQLGDDVPIELWIDDEGRTRRQQVEVTVKPSNGAGPATPSKVKTVVNLSDFGTEVDVEAPPSGKTADMTDELSQGSGRPA
ncbi:LppX_LprAFG lipoprotein [Streptomyces tubbatahanensis]|uniref:LppX_LprAFG lipoprotein n=1 Tax=Streptomyces tubbatahanensis TaxID=2923272 RepID=A0ABY3XPK1_9ACTN|nr:LppX_LprAFG lipoprotein [Streptomyces tubbatahanensis]UNS96346.1 LppX_LprAFG lipoprotein [Streptomyces tubbatahanensis]